MEPSSRSRPFPRLVPERPLPDRAYVPGQGPHPSAGRTAAAEPVIFWPRPEGWASAPGHLWAIDLFNHGFHWESHEAWEELWHQAPRGSAERIALKAMIQAAAAVLKRRMGQEPPADRLHRSSLLGLEAAATHGLVRGGPCLGLDLVDFARRFDAHWSHPDQEPFPYLWPIGRPPLRE